MKYKSYSDIGVGNNTSLEKIIVTGLLIRRNV